MCWAASQLTHCGRECSRGHTQLSFRNSASTHGLPWGPRPHTDLPRSPGATSTLLRPGHTLLHTLLCQVTSHHTAAVWIQPLVPLQRLCPEFSPRHTLLCGRIFPSLHTLHQRLPPPRGARPRRHPPSFCHTPPCKRCLLLHALLCAWDLPAPVISAVTYSTHSSR